MARTEDGPDDALSVLEVSTGKTLTPNRSRLMPDEVLPRAHFEKLFDEIFPSDVDESLAEGKAKSAQ